MMRNRNESDNCLKFTRPACDKACQTGCLILVILLIIYILKFILVHFEQETYTQVFTMFIMLEKKWEESMITLTLVVPPDASSFPRVERLGLLI